MPKPKRGNPRSSKSATAFVQQPVAQMASSPISALQSDYQDFLAELKSRIKSAQLRAVLAVNSELIQLYWTIGRDVLLQQKKKGWGSKVIDRLAADLHGAFPAIAGFSSRNLKYMRTFAEAYPEQVFVQQVVAQIPWGHNVRLLDTVKDRTEREWYICQTIENGWSRSMLMHWIASDLYSRQGKAANNFDQTLSASQSDLARELLKDPYNFDFLALAADASERELEKGLLDHVQKFLVELGAGFAFVGRQVSIEVDGEDFSIDLLFFHLRLRCFIIIDLKTGDFKPEFSGKMNFYLSAVDDLMRHPDDKPSIGLILCRTAKKTIAEYALRDLTKPVGIAKYVTKLVEKLPKELAGMLPSVQQIEAELARSSKDAE